MLAVADHFANDPAINVAFNEPAINAAFAGMPWGSRPIIMQTHDGR